MLGLMGTRQLMHSLLVAAVTFRVVVVNPTG